MAEASWPSPSHGSPARAVTDAEYPHLASWASDGVFASGSDVVYGNSSGMQVHVRANKYGIVRGHAWSSGTSEYNLTIGSNSSGSTRIDTVVLRLDRSTWNVTAAVRAGTPGGGAPALQRDTGDTGLWEIPLADVTVINGAASISAGNVKSRPLLQAGGARACTLLSDVQSTLTAGAIVWESSTGRWIGWNGSAGIVFYEDTGWIAATPDVTYWTVGAFPLGVRRIDGVVHLRGSVQRHISKLAITDSYSHIMTLQAGFRPANSHLYTVWVEGGIIAQARIYPSGDVALTDHAIDGISVNHSVYLDTTYPLG